MGTAYITITAGDSNYKTVTKKIKITVAPKKVKLTSVTSSKKKSVTIKWNKISDITGYKIQYSTNKNFKNAKTFTIGKGSVSKTYSNLKSGKRVYVRICSYKKTSQGTYQSNWSSVKSCVIK